MNTPNPLIPQGSFHAETKGSSNIRIAVFTIVAVHAVLFGGILMQGCKRDQMGGADPLGTSPTNTAENSYAPNLNTDYYPDYETFSKSVTKSGDTITDRPATNAEPPIERFPIKSNIVEVARPEPLRPIKPALETRKHTVVRNDNFSKIARNYNTSVAAIAQANPGVESTRLRIGQTLTIPAAEPVSTNKPSPGATSATGGGGGSSADTYTVKKGDTLSAIARKHNTSVTVLKNLNNLKTDRIFAGRKLKLPNTDQATAASNTAG